MNQNSPAPRPNRLTHGLLAACAVLLALNLCTALLGKPDPAIGLINTAQAQGVVNAADQREQMLAQLKSLGAKVDALSRKLSRPLTVRVEGDLPTDEDAE
ncbi:MAG: hypothetical protein AAF078_02550 [Planctomycetota bacterium]